MAAAALIVSRAADAGDVAKRGGFYMVRTAHYVVESDVGAEFAREIAKQMEEIYGAYQRVFRRVPGTAPKGFKVRVFKKKADYQQFVGKENAAGGGIFMPNKKTLATFVEGNPLSVMRETLYHEGFHQFMAVRVGYSPVWLNEGLAVLFQHSLREGKKIIPKGVPPAKLRVVQKAFENGDNFSLEDIMLMTHKQWNENHEKDRKLALYEYYESWLLVHFLAYAKPRYQEMLNKYIMTIKSGVYGEEAIAKAFGTKLGPMEKAWKKYVMQLKPTPVFVCMENLRCIALLCAVFKAVPAATESIEALRNAALDRRFKGWYIPLDEVTTVKAGDDDTVKSWFHCPLDKSGSDTISYELVEGPEKNPTFKDVICRHHKRGIIRATWLLDPATGKRNIDVLIEPEKK